MGTLRRPARRVLLLLLGALVLAGCSGPAATGQPGAGGSGQAHDGSQLKAVLEQFAQGRDDARILDDGQLRDSIPAAEAWVKQLEIDPAECGLTGTGSVAAQLEHASMAALQLDTSLITLASYDDAAQVERNFREQEQRNERCSRYTVRKDGQHVGFHMARQPVKTEARESSAHVLTSSDGTSATQQVMIRAAQANIMITINQPLRRADQAGQLQELAGQVNQLLELID